MGKEKYVSPKFSVVTFEQADLVRMSVEVDYTTNGGNNGWGVGGFDNPLEEANLEQ